MSALTILESMLGDIVYKNNTLKTYNLDLYVLHKILSN